MPQTFNVGARSWAVTLTAWIVIALAGAGAAAAMRPQWLSLLGAPAGGSWFAALAAVLGVAAIAAAIGLLQRLEWARRLCIGLLVVAIGALLAGGWLQHAWVHGVVGAALGDVALPPQAADLFGAVVTAARLLALALTLVVCALLGWMIRRLMSPSVRQEFA